MFDTTNTDEVSAALPTPDATPEKHEQVEEVAEGDLFDDSDFVEYAVQEYEQGHDAEQDQQEQEQEQVQEAVVAPTASTEEYAVEALVIANGIRESLDSTAVKRKRSDIDDADLTGSNTDNSLNPVRKEEDDEQTPEAIQPELIPSSSPPPSHQYSSSSPHAVQDHNKTAPTSPAAPLQSSPKETPVPLPQLSNAPPSFKPVKKRQQDEEKKPRATKKQPKTQTPAPSNSSSTPPQASPTPPVSSPSHNDAARTEELWCSCQQPDDGKLMIACDAPECEIEWFHARCVGIVKPPLSEKWYCPEHRSGQEGVARPVKRRKMKVEEETGTRGRTM